MKEKELDKIPNLEIEFSDPQVEAINIVKKEIGNIKTIFNWSLLGVIAALILGFITLLFALVAILIQAWSFYSAVKQNDLSNLNSVSDQEKVLEKINILESRIENIGK